MKTLVLPPHLEGKICKCKFYRTLPENVCLGCGVIHRVACDPPPCEHCGLWPPYALRKCDTCSQTFYGWFGPFISPIMGNPYVSPRCFPCLETGAFGKYLGQRPPAITLAPVQTVGEILNSGLFTIL